MFDMSVHCDRCYISNEEFYVRVVYPDMVVPKRKFGRKLVARDLEKRWCIHCVRGEKLSGRVAHG